MIEIKDMTPKMFFELLASVERMDHLHLYLDVFDVRGYKNNAYYCPIAEAFRKSGILGPFGLVAVSSKYISVGGSSYRIPDGSVLEEFIDSFDEGKYPKYEVGTIRQWIYDKFAIVFKWRWFDSWRV